MPRSLAASRVGAVLVAAVSLALPLAFSVAPAEAAPNKLPTVTLTSPANGATYTAPATIPLAASASDPDGTIARVEFYQGTTLLATRTASPYSFVWSNVAGGTYSLTARAVDDRGGTKTSTAVGITVSGAKLTITAPANGATLYASTVTVTGAFSGDSNTVVFVDNGNTTRVASITSNTYSATLPLAIGANTLRVVAHRSDRTWDQASVTVTGNAGPLLVFTSPSTTTFDAPANVTFAVDALSPASTISKVEFWRSNVLLGASTAPPYQATWTNVPAGSHSVYAFATDALGTTTSTSLLVNVRGPNVPPTVSLTAPSSGSVFTAPASIPLAASATDPDGTVALVEFLQNGSVIGSTNVSPYALTLSNVPAGSYALAARATDNRSAVTTSAPANVVVTTPNSSPTVTLTSPVSGAAYTAPATIALAATAADSDGSVSKVEFYAGATRIGTVTAPPWAFTWSGVAAGSYSLTARATDNLGATTASSAVAVTVSANQPPWVTLTAPAPGATFHAPATINLSATASDPDGVVSRVDFYADATLVATASGAPYAASWAGVGAGSYVVTARATDNAGASTTSVPVTVTVNAPTLTITSPVDNATIAADSVTVSGTISAAPNSGVTVNGVVAAIDATGHFYAQGVPLATGSNTISVTLTTLAGLTATTSITVVSMGPGPVRISASPTQGMAPLDVVFEVAPDASTTIRKIEVDIDGDGSYDQTLVAEPWSLTATYTGTGTVLAGVRVTDSQNVVRTETVPIVLVNPARLDQDLRAVWAGMTAALAAGDKPAAMRHLDAAAQQKYGPVFDALLPHMPQIVSSFSAPQSLSLSDGIGEYAINRIIDGENRIFLIYFGRNGDGVWRLGSM